MHSTANCQQNLFDNNGAHNVCSSCKADKPFLSVVDLGSMLNLTGMIDTVKQVCVNECIGMLALYNYYVRCVFAYTFRI